MAKKYNQKETMYKNKILVGLLYISIIFTIINYFELDTSKETYMILITIDLIYTFPAIVYFIFKFIKKTYYNYRIKKTESKIKLLKNKNVKCKNDFDKNRYNFDATNNFMVNDKKINHDNNIIIVNKDSNRFIEKKISMNECVKKYFLKDNENLYKFSSLLINEFDEDFPVKLLNDLADKNLLFLLNYIIIDTRKLTFLDYDLESYLYKEKVTEPTTAIKYLKLINEEIIFRTNLLAETKEKNIYEYNINCNNDQYLNYIFITINDVYDLCIDKINIDLLQNLIIKGKKVGIIFIMYTTVDEKYLKLKIAKNNIKSIAQQDLEKIILELYNENLPLNDKEFYNNYLELSTEFIKFRKKDSNKNYNNNNLKDVIDVAEEPLYDEIVDFVIAQGKASTALLQRRFRIGYNRAAHCIDLLEEQGIIGPPNGAKPREVLRK